MSPPLVSIIVPTYNRAGLVGRAIESVLAQKFTDWELIVVDDHSTDHSADVIDRYRRQDRRVRWVRNETHSHTAAGARNRGLEEITGPYVAFLDSDDAWLDHHLSELVACLDENPDVDWVFGDLRRVDPSGKVLLRSKHWQEWAGRGKFVEELRGGLHVLKRERFIENALRYGLGASLQQSLLRSEVLKKVPIREIAIGEDQLFVLEAAVAGFTFGYVVDCHVNYLIHDANLSGSNATASFRHSQKVHQAIAELWREHIPAHVPMTRTRRKIVRHVLANHLVWGLGNGVLRKAGQKSDAVHSILEGIRLCPWRMRYWKTLLGTLLRG